MDYSASGGRGKGDFPLLVVPNFISEEEEASLLAAVEPTLRRRRYEEGHWDAVITAFREFSRPAPAWPPVCQTVFDRAFDRFPRPDTQRRMEGIHVLDLAAHGAIGHHVDSVKFSGDIVCGMCLASDAIMELVPSPDGGDAAAPYGGSGGGGSAAEGGGGMASAPRAATPAADARRIRIFIPRRTLYMLMYVAMGGGCCYEVCHITTRTPPLPTHHHYAQRREPICLEPCSAGWHQRICGV